VVLVSASLLFLVYYAISGFLIVVRIPREERMMLEKFGEEYRVYMRRTGRLLPHFFQETGGKKEGKNQRIDLLPALMATSHAIPFF